MAFSPFPNRPFNLRENCTLLEQDIAGNRSRIGWELWIDKTGTSPTHSGAGSAWQMRLNGAEVGAWTGGFDFTGAGPWMVGSGSAWITHNADGTKTIAIDAFAQYDILGDTEVHASLTLPRIPRGPRVKVGSAWRHTVAYVNVNGTWRIAIPYVKESGTWRIGGS